MPDAATRTTFVSAVPALPVSDQRRAVAFFESALGMTEVMQDGTGLGILQRGAVELHVWVADGSAKGAEAYLAGSASCRIEVRGIEAIYAHCRELGVVHPNGALRHQPWGVQDFTAQDPDGNAIGIYERD